MFISKHYLLRLCKHNRDLWYSHLENSDKASYKEKDRPTWWPPHARLINPSGREKHTMAELDAIIEGFQQAKASEREQREVQEEQEEQVELSDSFVVNDGGMEDPFIVKLMIERVWLLLNE